MLFSKQQMIREIKAKKELSGLTDSIVSDILSKYLKMYNLTTKEMSRQKLKVIKKEVRAELRLLAGRFQKTTKRKSAFSTERLLETHSSTSERTAFYPELKRIISNMKAKSILDLGCGLNPLALADKNTKYYAADIKEDELGIIKNYFEKNKINGKTFTYDLRKIKNDLPRIDICLLFKVLDILDKNLAEKIIKSIPSKRILVSFATKKLSGKKMSHPKRIWFEKILERLNFKYETFNSDNEIFYLIEKT